MTLTLFLFFTICIYKISCEPVTFSVADQKCSPLFNLSSYSPEVNYFWKNGEFPPGKENLNCYFECVFKAVDIVDSNFMPTKNKLNELVEREKKEHSNAIFGEFIATDIVLEKCLPPKDMSSPCNIATNFISCFVDIRNIVNLSEFISKYGVNTDLRSADLKSIYSRNIIMSQNYCQRLQAYQPELF